MGWGGWDPPVDRSTNFRRAGTVAFGSWSPPGAGPPPPGVDRHSSHTKRLFRLGKDDTSTRKSSIPMVGH